MRHFINRLLKNGKVTSFSATGRGPFFRIDLWSIGRTSSVLVFLWYEAGANVFVIPPYPASTRAPFAHMTQVSKTVEKIMRSLASFYQSFTKNKAQFF